ncbi:MAG TPA: hypothetical protein PLK62_05535, partial [Bacteroidales bacterium]|nr:hypothetical protein [Bacteroidales bacterium]
MSKTTYKTNYNNKNNSKNQKNTKNSAPSLSNKKNQFLDKPLYIYLLLFISCLLVYFNSFQNELIYNWDDGAYVYENPYISSLNWNNIKAIFTSFYPGNYHPLTLLLNALIYHFVGNESFLYHFVQFIFHVLNTFLV